MSEANADATTQRLVRRLPTMPHISPHSLRRTYISLALLASDYDIKWVMSQVGHADSKMTLDVYAQLGQYVPRHHGENLDLLLREARQPRLTGALSWPSPPSTARYHAT